MSCFAVRKRCKQEALDLAFHFVAKLERNSLCVCRYIAREHTYCDDLRRNTLCIRKYSRSHNVNLIDAYLLAKDGFFDLYDLR